MKIVVAMKSILFVGLALLVGCGGPKGAGGGDAGSGGVPGTAGEGGGSEGGAAGTGVGGGAAGAAGEAAGVAGAVAGTTGAGGAGGTGGTIGSGAGGGANIDAGGDAGDAFQPELGDWLATTSQGLAMTFTVVPGGIGTYVVQYDGTGCSAGVGATKVDGTPIAAIVDRSFTTSATLKTGSIGSYTLSGSFDSASSASGTFTFNLTAVGASDCGGAGTVTWTAMPRGDAGIPCRLSNCGGTTSLTFSYSCGTASSSRRSSTRTEDGGTVAAMLTVTFTNGHVVTCENVASDGGRSRMCTDDTGVTCTW